MKTRLFTSSRLRAPFVLTCSFAMIVTGGVSHAATNTWKVATGDWASAASWTAAPATTDDAVFSDPAVGGSPVTASLAGNKVANSLTFQSSSTTLLNATSGNRSLTLAAGLTVQTGAGAVTLSTAANASNGILFSADQTWTNDSTLLITSIVKPSTGPNTLTITGTGSTVISGNILDAASPGFLTLVKSGTGTLTLGGSASNFTGGFAIKAGIVSTGTFNNSGSNGPLGRAATITMGDASSTTGTLSYTGANASSSRLFTMAAGGTGAFEVTNSATSLTLSGVIDGTGVLKKTGPGTLTLSSAGNSYGITEIAEGTLKVNGTVGAVSISATGTLAGAGGSVGGAVTMVSGSTVAPGTTTTTGTLNTTGDLTFVSGAVFDADINTDLSSTDLLVVGGNLNLAGATLAPGNIGVADPVEGAVFTIATYTGTLSGTFAGRAEGATVVIAGKNYTLKYADTGNNITLTAQAVVGTPYDAWAALKITAIDPLADATPAGDPDGDGTSNLGEFAFNGNPLSGSDGGQVYLLTEDSDFDSPDTAKELILTIAVRESAPAFAGSPSPVSTVDGVTYTIQGSTTLGSFDTVVNVVPTPVTTGLPAVGTGYVYRSFSLEGSNNLAGKGFLRAKASN